MHYPKNLNTFQQFQDFVDRNIKLDNFLFTIEIKVNHQNDLNRIISPGCAIMISVEAKIKDIECRECISLGILKENVRNVMIKLVERTIRFYLFKQLLKLLDENNQS